MLVKHITEKQDLEHAFSIRKQVFVLEQGVPLADEFDEFDEFDSHAIHVLVYEKSLPAGTGRMRISNGAAKLERICVLPMFRKSGVGQAIVRKLEKIAISQGLSKALLHGQTHAEVFYRRLGYKTSSEVFMEDGIPHVLMEKSLP